MIKKDDQNNSYVCTGYGDAGSDPEIRCFHTISQAREWELSRIDLTSVCREDETDELYFFELADRFIADKAARLRPLTLLSYKGILEKIILPCFGKMPAESIRPAHIRMWQNSLMALSYKPGYLKKINSLLSSVFRFGARFYGLKINPVALAGAFVREKSHDECRFWTPEEYGIFISDVEDMRLRLIFNTLYWTGMRLGELLALTPEDIDLVSESISISKTYNRLHGKDLISPPKTAKGERTILLNSSLAKDYSDYLSLSGFFDRNSRIFTINSQTLRRRFYRIADEQGLRRIRLHDLRHSHASYLVNNDTPLTVVAERLGHEQTETTFQTYTHAFENTETKILKPLEDEFVRLGCSGSAHFCPPDLDDDDPEITYIRDMSRSFDNTPSRDFRRRSFSKRSHWFLLLPL